MNEERMSTTVTRPGPIGRAARPSLGDQLDRLDGILNGLSDALNESVAAAVAAAVGKAVREGVKTAAREMAARSALTAARTTHPEVTGGRPVWRHFIARWCKSTRRGFASAKLVAESLFDRLGALIVASVHRTTRAPQRLAVGVVAGIVAGATAGVGGPLMGAALGGLAGFVAALTGPRQA
jgi:hypothetical protein